MVPTLQNLCLHSLAAALSGCDAEAALRFFIRRGPQSSPGATSAMATNMAASEIPEHFLVMVLEHARCSPRAGCTLRNGLSGGLTDGVLGGCLGPGCLKVLDLSSPGSLQLVSGKLLAAIRPQHLAHLSSLALSFDAAADVHARSGITGGIVSDGAPLAEASEVLALAALALSCAPLKDLELIGYEKNFMMQLHTVR